MDVELLKRGLLEFGKYTRSKKRLVLLLVALSFSSYGAHKACNLSRIDSSLEKGPNLIGAVSSVTEVVSQTAEAIGIVSREVKDFLPSDTDTLPNSLKQMNKFGKSTELSESVANLTQGVVLGIMRGYHASEAIDTSHLFDQILDKLSSPAGLILVSTIIESSVRNIIAGVYEEVSKNSNHTDVLSRLIETATNSNAKYLIGDSIQLFVSTAVAVYLEKTMHVNTFDEFFRGMTNPEHEAEVRETLVCVCSKAMETLVKTFHQVMNTDTEPGSWTSPALDLKRDKQCANEEGDLLKANDTVDRGWINSISTILAVPSNRSLVLDITKRVTFETIRTFLDFLLEKLSQAITKFFNIIHELIEQIKLQATEYVYEKSSAAATLFLCISLHMMDSIWMFSPA